MWSFNIILDRWTGISNFILWPLSFRVECCCVIAVVNTISHLTISINLNRWVYCIMCVFYSIPLLWMFRGKNLSVYFILLSIWSRHVSLRFEYIKLIFFYIYICSSKERCFFGSINAAAPVVTVGYCNRCFYGWIWNQCNLVNVNRFGW